MKDKTVVITGGSSGIGLATARILAEKGARILLVSENEEELKKAANFITDSTNNKAIEYYVADLTSQKEVVELVHAIKEKHQQIDALINNAGGVFAKFEASVDGLEKTIALNHFAPYLLTSLLLDTLKKSPRARIINVASRSHFDGSIDFDSFASNYRPGFKKQFSDFIRARPSLKILYSFMGYFLMTAYAQSKLANIMFTVELAEKLRGSNITVNCLHPGFVNTAVGSKHTPWYSQFFWYAASAIGGIDVNKAAASSVYLACAAEVEGITGKYFEHNCITEPLALVQNVQLRQRLMEETQKLIRFS